MNLSTFVVAAALFLVTAAVNLEVPLYPTYAQAAGYGTGLTAVVFAFYVAGLLPVLLLFGGISDKVGRKTILLLGLLVAFGATLLVTLVPTIQALLLARVLQGIGVGLSVGTGTAFLAELWGEGGASAAAALTAVTTSLGFGGGALLTSAVLLQGTSTTPASYGIVLGAIAGVMLATLFLPSPKPVGGTIMRLPAFPKGSVTLGFAIATAWAVTGLVISVVPSQLSLQGLAAWSGPALFLVNGTGALMQPWARRLSAERSLLVGFVLLPVGYALLVLGAWWGALSLILLGASVSGAACYGFTYLGGLTAVSVISGDSRARAVSGYLLFAYVGFGAPSVLVGFLAERIGVPVALAVFLGVVIVVCGVLACIIGTKSLSKVASQA